MSNFSLEAKAMLRAFGRSYLSFEMAAQIRTRRGFGEVIRWQPHRIARMAYLFVLEPALIHS